MGYDEAAHREHIRWCCQQLDAIKTMNGLPPTALKALRDSIDQLNQTFASRSRLEAALSNHLGKTLQAQDALQRALNKLGDANDKLNKTEAEYSVANKKLLRLERAASFMAARASIERAADLGKWLSCTVLIIDSTKLLYDMGCYVRYDTVVYAARKEFELNLRKTEQFERHPNNGMLRKRRNLQPGA